MNTRNLLKSRMRRRSPRPGVIAAELLSLCVAGYSGDNDPAPSAALACDDGLKTAFKPDADPSVMLVNKCAFDGAGMVTVGDLSWEVVRGDLFVVPPWKPFAARTGDASALDLFRFNDAPIFEVLHAHRTQIGN